ncbi:hypothetical protein PJN91_17345 [Mycobacterium kansasii]
MITVVVPVSLIPSHPDTAILDETLDSIRFHHPTAEIIVTFDGVRAEQSHRYNAYEEFIRRALWRCDKVYGGVVPFIWEQHLHQVGMLRRLIDEITTPLMLFVEQDAPLVIDEPIDWEACIDMVTSGEANIIRYAHEGVIPAEHLHMMHGQVGQFMRTSQYSARPHLASVAYYRRALDSYFSPGANCFVEDVLHGVIDTAYRRDGLQGWMQHRVWLYHPDGGNVKRSYTTDGRAGEPKFDADQRF